MIHLDWEPLFTSMFGTLDGMCGLNVGFWVSMVVVAIVVLIENIVFWGMRPRPDAEAIAAKYQDHYFDTLEDNEDE